MIITTLFILACAAHQGVSNRPHFFIDSIKEGQTILKMYKWSLIRVDTLKDKRTFIFYYKDESKD